jgi:hypothetical protein
MDWNSKISNGSPVEVAVMRLPAPVAVTDHRYGGAILLNPGLLPIHVAASNWLCPNASQEGLGRLDTNFPIPSYRLIRGQVKSRAKLRIQSFGSEILWIPLHL